MSIQDVLRRTIFCGLLFAVLAVNVGCAPVYEVDTPANMVAVEEDDHEYVAMTHDGIVLRALIHAQGDGPTDVPNASHDFWVDATRERMRTRGGYALLDESEVQSANGHKGTRLEFGRDQNGEPFVYWVTLFVTEDYIHVLDAGGRQDRFEGAKDSIEEAISSYQVLK